MVFISIKNTSFKNETILLKKYVIFPLKMFLIVEHNIYHHAVCSARIGKIVEGV